MADMALEPRHLGPSLPAALRRATAEGVLPGPDAVEDDVECLSKKACGLFYDLDAWDGNLKHCLAAFGPGFVHCKAVKSNPVFSMLQMAKGLGFGAECASIGEVLHAQKVGFPTADIIFDSPVKARSEIRHALRAGVHLNIDNFEELEVVAKVISSLPEPSKSDIGLRINPLVGQGEIAMLSVSTGDSKFGIGITRKEEIIAAFKKFSWLNCVHVHVGSGGMGVEVLCAGVKVAVGLAIDVNAELGQQQVQVMDIGGGLPVNYDSEEWRSPKVPSFTDYANALRERVPELFPNCSSGSMFRKVITEFGQSLSAKSGWLASRVEYVKPLAGGDGEIVMIHFGADMCVRQAYTNEHNRRLGYYDGETFAVKTTPGHKTNVAGPLCFQGDHLTMGSDAPQMRRGDIVVMREAGSNCLSLFSRHCMRQALPVYGYRLEASTGEVSEWRVLKEIESFDSLHQFWGAMDGVGSAERPAELPPIA